MTPEFAYSRTAHILLVVFSFVQTFIFLYLIASLILTIYDEKARVRQKLLFAFLTGTLLNNVWVYAVYIILGSSQQTPLVYLLVTTTNPIFALCYYYFGIKVFKLSKTKSVTLMSHTYLYYIIEKSANRLIGSVFFVQRGGDYNFLTDIFQQTAALAFVAASYGILLLYCRRHASQLRIYDGIPGDYRAGLTGYFLKSLAFYMLLVIVPVAVDNAVIANLFVLAILILSIVLQLTRARARMHAADLTNKNRHIIALQNSVEEFSGVKHDFYNVLSTYSGYLETGNWEALKRYHTSLTNTAVHAGTAIDLSRKLEENPALVALLMNKSNDAAAQGVNLQFMLWCDLRGLGMEELDICRVMSCLLDNAIEAAANSEQKRATCTAAANRAGSTLFILSNTAPAPTTCTPPPAPEA
ncbi:MAG: GHKL domain-containing protein [Oscillospiraceae bacterium]|jgi:hypothetical protein|nr:GHKL domain-containing protein [Oscillospiraceae bacterium]